MTGTKTNERPGVRAYLNGARFSAYKAREVLNLIRGKSVAEAQGILLFSDRGASEPILKLLESAVANAGNNNDIPPDELFISACFADEGPTMRRFRPRARGRGARIRKRTCNITIIVGRMSAADLERTRAKQAGRRVAAGDATASRARRVARSRKSGEATGSSDVESTESEAPEIASAETAEVIEVEAADTHEDAEVTGTDVEDAAEASADENADEEKDA